MLCRQNRIFKSALNDVVNFSPALWQMKPYCFGAQRGAGAVVRGVWRHKPLVAEAESAVDDGREASAVSGQRGVASSPSVIERQSRGINFVNVSAMAR
jgi:hypothetical protein